MKKYITTIILVVIFISLLGYFWFFESGKEDKEEIDGYETKSFIVWELNRDNINNIESAYGNNTVKLEKQDDGGWKMTKPKKSKAKEDKVNMLLNSISNIEARGEEITYENLAEFGLEKPKATVRIGFTDDSEKEIIFGDESIGGTEVYAKTSDKDFVFLINKNLLDSVKFKEEDLKE